MTTLVSTLKTQLVGRQEISTILASSGVVPITGIPLDPVSVGDRPNAVSAAFERYKIIRMRVHFRSTCPSTLNGGIVFGIHDDTVVTAPTSSDVILNYRVSKEDDVWKDITIDYVPVDREKWYYINAESSGDARFVTQATLYFGSTTATGQITLPANTAGTFSAAAVSSGFPVGKVTLEYHYLFDGATILRD